jgi:hypothetical protein
VTRPTLEVRHQFEVRELPDPQGRCGEHGPTLWVCLQCVQRAFARLGLPLELRMRDPGKDPL